MTNLVLEIAKEDVLEIVITVAMMLVCMVVTICTINILLRVCQNAKSHFFVLDPFEQ